MTDEQAALAAEKKGKLCRCGFSKAPHKAVCRACYRRLPPVLRPGIYLAIGAGYEPAFAIALKFLRDNKRVPIPTER